MLSLGPGRHLWDPYRVLDVNPNHPSSTCVGTASSTGSRCRWHFDSEQFTASRRTTADEQMKSMSEAHPSAITSAALYSLARNTLCRDFHQGQVDAVEAKWRTKIQTYVREHGDLLAVLGTVRELQSGIASDRDAHEQEMKKAREALEESRVRCAELTDKYTRFADDQSTNSRDLATLRRQLMEMQTSATAREERDAELGALKGQFEGRSKDLERDIAANSKKIRELKDGKARLDDMMTTNTMKIWSMKARAKKSEEEADELRQRFESSDRDIAGLKEAKASFEDKVKLNERETESLRKALEESSDRFEETARLCKREAESLREESNAHREAFEGKCSKDSKRLGEQLEALDRNYSEHVGQLEKQMEGLRQDLAKREEQLSSLQAPKKKKGLFGVIRFRRS